MSVGSIEMESNLFHFIHRSASNIFVSVHIEYNKSHVSIIRTLDCKMLNLP